MKIGLLPLYIALYDDIVPENGVKARAFIPQISAKLEARGFEVVSAPACRLKNEFADAVKLFEESGCEAIATLHLAYSPSLESIDALAGTGLPLVIIDTTPDFEFIFPSGISFNHGIHGVQDMCNLLLRRKKKFLISAGHWEDPALFDRVARQLQSAGMAQHISHARVGKVGGDFEGMGDFRIPEGALPGLQVIDFVAAGGPSEAEIEAEMAKDRERFEFDPSVNAENHRRTIIASLKLRKFAEKEKLTAFTITFGGITYASGWDTVPFLECSKAMERGIGYAGEGDVLTAAVTRCLMEVFPETSFTEMFCPDWKNNLIFTSHMGEINPRICAAQPNLHEMNYRFSDTGKPVLATGCFKPGKAVLTNLAPGADGKFTLIAVRVTYEAPAGASPMANAGYFRPDNCNICDFLAAYSKVGGTHHLSCSYNADTAILRDWAELMGWDFVEI